MLSIYEVMLLKEQHNNQKILYFQFGKHDFVFRMLGVKEYSQIKLLTNSTEDLHDSICQLTVLHPQGYIFTECPVAGITDSIAKEIISYSLLDDDMAVIDSFELSKERTKRFLTQCILFIKAAFPEYKFEEIEEWTYERIMDMTAKAEYVLKLQGSEFELTYNKEDLTKEAGRKSDRELTLEGLDPMFYNSDMITLKQPLVSHPVIMGIEWQNEEVMEDVQQQILRRQGQ